MGVSLRQSLLDENLNAALESCCSAVSHSGRPRGVLKMLPCFFLCKRAATTPFMLVISPLSSVRKGQGEEKLIDYNGVLQGTTFNTLKWTEKMSSALEKLPQPIIIGQGRREGKTDFDTLLLILSQFLRILRKQSGCC